MGESQVVGAEQAGGARIAVVGDSVAWGQGLLPEHKYVSEIAAKIDPAAEINLQAHSGAIIGVDYHDGQPGADQEVPEATPTILSQVDQVPEPDGVDLVLINGGINDVGIQTILNPLTKNSSLHSDTINACYRDMKSLLAKVAQTFTKPSCQFRVTGYFPILSSESDLEPNSDGDRLARLLGLHGLAIPINLDRTPIVEHICSLTLQFWRESETCLAQAVTETATELNLTGRLLFVASPYAEGNALFTGDPWLFGLSKDLGPADEVAAPRAVACKIQYPNPLEIVSREKCYHASIGHPNVAGAAAIAAAILKTMS